MNDTTVEFEIKKFVVSSIIRVLKAHIESTKPPHPKAAESITQLEKLPPKTKLPLKYNESLASIDSALLILEHNDITEIIKNNFLSEEDCEDISYQESSSLPEELIPILENGTHSEINVSEEQEYIPEEYEGYVKIDDDLINSDVNHEVEIDMSVPISPTQEHVEEEPVEIKMPTVIIETPAANINIDELMQNEKFMNRLSEYVFGRAVDNFKAYINDLFIGIIHEEAAKAVREEIERNKMLIEQPSYNLLESKDDLQSLVDSRRNDNNETYPEDIEEQLIDSIEAPQTVKPQKPNGRSKWKRFFVFATAVVVIVFAGLYVYANITKKQALKYESAQITHKENLLPVQPVMQPPVQQRMSTASVAPKPTPVNAEEATRKESKDESTTIKLKPISADEPNKNKPTSDVFEYVQYNENGIHIVFKANATNRLQLSKNETLVDIEGKDTEKWKVNYNKDKNIIQIVPTESKLSNNIIITTNKRKYKINAVSRIYKANNLIKFQF